MDKIAVLLTCYNRKEKTIKCLEKLYNQNMHFDVYLVDDGCSDGTGDAVNEFFPQVKIIEGNGSLFWNRGMYTAWTEAEKKDYDYYIWLNDDTFLFDQALKMMLDCSEKTTNSLIVGASCSPFNSTITTFGADYKGKPVYPNGKLQQCDSFGGNFVLIPKIIYKTCGKLDWYYRHSLGDIDYAKTVLKSNFCIYLAPYHIGECEDDPKESKWKDTSLSLKKRFQLLHTPLSYSDPREQFYYYKKHYNAFIGILHVISIYSKLFIKRE